MKLSAYSRARFSDGLACSTRPSRKKSWIRRAALSCRSPRTCFRAIRPRQLRWMTRLHQLRVKRTSTERRRCSVWIVRAAECRVSAGDDASGGGEGADDARARGRQPRVRDDDGRRAASWYAERMRASSWMSLRDVLRLRRARSVASGELAASAATRGAELQQAEGPTAGSAQSQPGAMATHRAGHCGQRSRHRRFRLYFFSGALRDARSTDLDGGLHDDGGSRSATSAGNGDPALATTTAATAAAAAATAPAAARTRTRTPRLQAAARLPQNHGDGGAGPAARRRCRTSSKLFGAGAAAPVRPGNTDRTPYYSYCTTWRWTTAGRPQGTLADGSDGFECDDQTCIPGGHQCDAKHQCPDGSDELGCDFECIISAGVDGYRCSDGSCVAGERLCDGESNCADGSDELGCSFECVLPHGGQGHMCSDGRCIHSSYACDGEANCADGSDEMGCGFQCTARRAPGVALPRRHCRGKHVCDGS